MVLFINCVTSLTQKVHSNINGGDVAGRNTWPWIVRLEIVVSGVRGNGDCGGTIIDDRLIVTAAHCVQGATEVRAFLGDHDSVAQDRNERMVTTSTFVVHPNYRQLSSGALQFDVAIVKFNEQLTDGILADRACLPASTNLTLDNAKCWTAGWGNSDYRGTLLKEV